MNKELQSVQQDSATDRLESVDNITERLIKARAVLDLLQQSGKDIKNGFGLDHLTIMNSLWCIDGLLREAETGVGSL